MKDPKQVVNTEAKKLTCTDLTYLLKRTKANPELMMEMISLYLEQTPPLIATMNQGLQDKDWESIRKAVHKMLPSFSIMGISADIENMARTIQEYAGAQKETDKIPSMVLQLENICMQACKELEEKYNTISKLISPQ
jgi:HPt (histidine-containing phosphotransfer) domain-containing protein